MPTSAIWDISTPRWTSSPRCQRSRAPVPEMRPVENWYFDLPGFEDFLKGYVRELEADDEVRPVVTKAIAEFWRPP